MPIQLRPLAVAILPALTTLFGCSTAARHDQILRSESPRLEFAAAVFGERGVTPNFTVQGVLNRGGLPVTDTIPVIATIEDTDAGVLLLTSPVLVLVSQDGLFTVDVPLPDAGVLADAGEVEIVLRDAGTSEPIGGPLPMTHAPRAWSASSASTSTATGPKSSAATSRRSTKNTASLISRR